MVGWGEGSLGEGCGGAAAVVGTIGGAIVGYVAGSSLGDHTGFQYVVDVDDTDDDISIVQSGAEQIPIGSRVTIAIGTNTRIIILLQNPQTAGGLNKHFYVHMHSYVPS